MIDAGFVDSLRLGGGDVHGDVVGELFVAADHVDENADTGAMDILFNEALSFDAGEAAERHVFADLADESLADAFNRGFTERKLEERSDVGRVLFGDELDGFASHLQELGVLRNEVRFGVHFEDRTELLVVGDVDHHDAFGRHAAGSLRGFVAELDAQDFFSLGHVAIGFRKRLLALHHRGVGLETQFLHLGGGNSSHVLLLQN